jgi:alkanesulfonate monooxygenase SsuD/methylene tetrahydromethanopterin reductase-like flavin-dependent oxidoreductase (luciferase family)
VHDSVWFELHGKPALFIASSAFADAAQAQADALGLPDVRRIFVPHPIQDATDEEMQAKADAIVEEVIEALTSLNR